MMHKQSLDSLCLIVADCPHSTPKWTDSGVCVLGANNVKNGRIDYAKMRFTNEKNYLKRIKRAVPRENDIVITREAPMGEVCLVPGELKCCLGQRVVLLRVDPKKASSRFVFYALQSPGVQHQISWNEGTGSTVSNLRIPHLKELQIPSPAIETQKAIAHILGTLDDKIELNRRMNETLEAMAQALFKSWFVDFDPVKAKMEGWQPEGMDAETAALFPDKLVESELGLIPEGWEPFPLKKFIAIKHGFAFKGKYFSKEPTDDILLTPGNFQIGGGFKDHKFKYYSGPTPEDYILNEGELLVSMTDLSKASDTLGYPALVPSRPPLTFLHNQRLGKISFKEKSVGKYYVYHQLCSSAYRDEILAGASGTTVKHTSPTKILAYKFPFSGGRLETLFEKRISSIMDRIQTNDIHSSTLVETRDALLPKLISGELSTN